MRKRIFPVLVFLVFLTILPSNPRADFPTGTLSYHDSIIADAEFEWTVAKFSATGDFSSYTDEVYIGDTILSQGDKIKVVVLEDPDEAVGIWFDVYINEVKVNDPEDFWIGNYGYLYGIGGFFINPISYTNATGTFSLYEQIFEELQELNDEYSTDYSYAYGGMTVEMTMIEQVSFSMKGDILVIYLYERMYMSMKGGGYDETMEIEMKSETTINTITGLLGKSELLLNADTSYYSGKFELRIDSGYAKTPFSWSFSILGIMVIASVIVLVKRKK